VKRIRSQTSSFHQIQEAEIVAWEASRAGRYVRRVVQDVVQSNPARPESPPAIRGYIRIKFENGTEKRIPVRATSAIIGVEFDFESQADELWRYDDLSYKGD